MIAVAAAESTRWPGQYGEDDYPFMQFMMNETLGMNNQTVFMRARIGNLTFDGIDSPLLHMEDIGGAMGDAINASIPFDRFGWFYSVSKTSWYLVMQIIIPPSAMILLTTKVCTRCSLVRMIYPR